MERREGMVGLSSGCSSFPNAVIDGKLTDGPRQRWLRGPGGNVPALIMKNQESRGIEPCPM